MFSIRRHDQQAGRVEGCSYEQPLTLGKGRPCPDKMSIQSTMPFQLPDFLLALESRPSPAPRSPRYNSSSPSASRSPLSGSQKLRYAAYEPPPPARPRRSRAASSTRSTYSLDAHEDLSRTVTAGDLAIAAGSPEIRALSLVRTPLLRKMIKSDIESSRSRCAARPSLPFPRHDWSPLIYSYVCLVVSTPISQLHTQKNETESPRRSDLPRLALHTRA